MQIPILNGIFSDEDSDFRTSYPRNMIPVPKQQGISKGYLRPADGIVQLGAGIGRDRGAINWRGLCYRVSGNQLISVAESGTVSLLGFIPGTDQVTFDYSFDRLSIAANQELRYWNGAALQQVTDPDLGVVIDQLWVDGYFMTTDGTSLIVTDINDPFSINPTRYGSSEADPDPIKALLKIRNEPIALNRHTCETFENVGGDGFPFARIEGAQIQRGVVGTHACAVYREAVAFLGGGRNEAPAIWIGANGSSIKISTREIDTLLQEHTEQVLSGSILEVRVEKSHEFLYVHLPDVTLVHDAGASQELGEQVWFKLTTSLEDMAQYQARNLVWCYNRWVVGHPNEAKIGYLTTEIASHWGEMVGWDFGTLILYNESRGAIINQLELVGLPGRAALGDKSTVWTSFSADGETWSVERAISAGKRGERNKRLVWFQQGHMRNWRIQRFRGTSDAMLSVARLEAQIEGLSV